MVETDDMIIIASSVIAVIGTLLGIAIGYVLQARLSARQVNEVGRDRRREDYVNAATNLASSVSTLIQAEYNRAKHRFNDTETEQRERARQDVYDKRTATRSAAYRLQLVGNPVEDAAMIRAAEDLIEQCRAISTYSRTMDEVEAGHRNAKQGLAALVNAAHRRVNEI